MGILESTRHPKQQPGSGRWIVIPRRVNSQSRRRNRIIRRRRQNFLRLVVLAVSTFALAWVPALRWMLWVNLAADVTLALYVWRLIEWKNREKQRRRVVTPLTADDPHSFMEPGVGVFEPEAGRASGRPIAKSG